MGCDLHAYLVGKDKNGEYNTIGLWRSEEDGVHELVECYNGRDYLLFGLLTGGIVRCNIPDEVPQMDEPRGIVPAPFVLPYAIAKEYDARWQGDAHSETWFSLKELNELYHMLLIKLHDEYYQECAESMKDFLHNINMYLEFADAYLFYNRDDIYVVCWFDN